MSDLIVKLSDGIHTYKSYDSKPSVTTGEALTFKKNNSNIYVPLTTVKKNVHTLALKKNNKIMYPIEGNLNFYVDIDHSGNMTVISDTFEEIKVGQDYHGTTYPYYILEDPNGVRTYSANSTVKNYKIIYTGPRSLTWEAFHMFYISEKGEDEYYAPISPDPPYEGLWIIHKYPA